MTIECARCGRQFAPSQQEDTLEEVPYDGADVADAPPRLSALLKRARGRRRDEDDEDLEPRRASRQRAWEEEDDEVRPSFTAATGLGMAALGCAAIGFLFLLLPRFWFLAVPVGGLGVILGGTGLFFIKGKPTRDVALVVFGIAAAVGMLMLSGMMALYVQYELQQNPDQMQRDLQNLR